MSSTFQTAAAISWGDQNNQIPLSLQDFPFFSDQSPDQMRKVRAEVRIRLDRQGRIHALSDAPLLTAGTDRISLHHFGVDGQWLGATSVALDRPATEAWQIIDYAVDAGGNSYLLENLGPVQKAPTLNRLRRIGADGQVRWVRTGTLSQDLADFHALAGNFSQLLIDGQSNLYLAARQRTGTLARLDSDSGETVSVHRLEEDASPLFMNSAGQVFFTSYLPDRNRRAMASFDPGNGAKRRTIGDDNLFGWLIHPIGVDRESRFFTVMNSEIARISFQGRIEWKERVDNIVVRPWDQAVFVSQQRRDADGARTVEVQAHLPAGESVRSDFPIPSSLAAASFGVWRLIHVSDDDRFFIFGGEEPGRAGTLLVYSKEGRLEEQVSPPPDLLPMESCLEGQRHWVVDSEGRIYLPVTDSLGFRVVRLQPQANR